ncbi:MAG TPA: hypothetical protein VJT73_21410, partial [Polyangiaceae bacterium]|nr:hypothetical protein [Polyangiaceae bacterium]
MSSSKKPDVRLNIPAKPLLPSAGAPLPLPAVLSTGVRSASGEGDALLPSDYIKVVDVFDIRSAARSPAGLEAEPDIALPVDRVVVLELTDGTSVITSAEKLADTLQRLSNAPARAADRGATAEEEPAPSLNALAERAQATRFGLADIGDLVSRVFTLDVGSANDAVVDEAKKLAVEWAKKRGGDALAKILEGGPSYLGTKALMWVIERRAGKDSGLRRWRAQGKSLELDRVTADDVAKDAQEGPLLVFIHGTGSSTAGSFSDIASESAGYLQSLESKFGRRIYGFEHRTFSESPIENAIELASSLPKGARVSLVTHSRGGLVGDLVCLSDFDGQIESYGRKDKAKPSGIEEIYGAQQQQLRDLSILLKNRELIIERYVRVASPARGTLLASGNLDAFLSGFLSLMGLVPALAASPLYPAFKRILLEIAKNRTRPELVPGIEAMLPESPLARLLGEAKPQKDVRMSVIAGDTDSGSILKRLGVFFTDYVFFDGHNNDLVVDTDSMYAGIARNAGARVHDERGPEVTHFRYFRNEESRIALSRWLLDPDVAKIKEFNSLPVAIAEPSSQAKAERAALRAATRGARDAELPIVVVLPGIMGSHLWVNRRDRIWFDVADLARGGLRSRLSWGAAGVEAESLFDHFYGDLCDHLEQSHEVERFAYDWRQPLDVLGASLGERLFALMDRVRGTERPIRFLAHSMGGLVVRSLAHQNAALFEELMGREGARFVMLGTPNRGSHAMVETLIGKASMIRMLARLDLTTDLAGILQAVGAFRGALSLLPRPDFQDGNVDGARNYFDEKLWAQLHGEVEDFWFGKNFCPALPQATLDQGNWKFDSVPTAQVKSKTIYVYGSADRTPCGLRKLGNGWKMLATTMGDGSVTWASGNVPGIGSSFFMPVEHGALACTERYFDGLTDLLAQGTTDRLQTVPAMRGIPAGDVIAYDAGPPLYPTDAEIAGGFLGRGRVRARPKEQPLLRIAVRAMDLRWVQHPVLIGHYTEDPIAGAEAVVDEQLLDGQLSVRKNLGLYSGPIGSATVVLLAQNDLERQRGSARGGVVIGLGSY